ncbi:DUF4198 domain-containing protein [Chitinivibrio alkaliphilus]|uniref:Co2+ ABC transporter substrate-binding protein n=1 Tax=Chitinivibrio alkaliphilus ACht1 TaxID=1313304 RepID=U7D3C3_9BACT|nr:DUF4198 domain-containing protein [Chitinivibrio alkaliphilus]ERP31004.1 Co2+ ABC transporter substrate-binding protein [Chitinivibrio alkaliphilus ACht1]
MKMMKCVLALCAVATLSYGHFPWIHSDGFSLSPNSNVRMYVGWGHGFPFGAFMDSSQVDNLQITGPNGAVSATFENSHRFAADDRVREEGVYFLSAERPASYYSQTTEGGQRGSKEDLADEFHVRSCTYTHSFMKALVNVGQPQYGYDIPVGHDFEVIPQKNPLHLSQGDVLPVVVLLHGEPVAAEINATYAGYSRVSTDDDFVYETSTDETGTATIPLSSHGVWLLEVVLEQGYADTDVCDIERFRSVLTFEVPGN